MNERQRRFADLVFQGRPAGRAYEEAGYDARGKTADEAASRLSRNAKVKSYLEELRRETQSATVMSGLEIRETLTRCIKAAEKSGKWGAVSSLVDRLAKLDQLYEPQNIKHTLSREEIADRVRLVSPLIAARIRASGVNTPGWM